MHVLVTADDYIKSPFVVKPNRLVSDLYVYADVVEHQCVPLLRTIADSGKGGEILSWSNFGRSTGVYESIDIAVTDALGRPVRFLFGEIIIKLHFR